MFVCGSMLGSLAAFVREGGSCGGAWTLLLAWEGGLPPMRIYEGKTCINCKQLTDALNA